MVEDMIDLTAKELFCQAAKICKKILDCFHFFFFFFEIVLGITLLVFESHKKIGVNAVFLE